MAISKKQKELDLIKWEKSVKEGKDACGSFDYCVKCDKKLENPCEKAFNAFNAKKAVAKKSAPAKKTAVKKPAKKEVAVTKVATKKPATKAVKKPVAKKK